MVDRSRIDSARAIRRARRRDAFRLWKALSPPRQQATAWFRATDRLRTVIAKAAVEQVERITANNESAIEANEMEVALREQLDEEAGAARALETH